MFCPRYSSLLICKQGLISSNFGTLRKNTVPWSNAFWPGLTPFDSPMWQAEADTDLTMSASPTTAVGQKHPIKNRKAQRLRDIKNPDCRPYMTCSKHIQTKFNKGGCIWNYEIVLGLRNCKLSCGIATFNIHFLNAFRFFNKVKRRYSTVLSIATMVFSEKTPPK